MESKHLAGLVTATSALALLIAGQPDAAKIVADLCALGEQQDANAVASNLPDDFVRDLAEARSSFLQLVQAEIHARLA